MQETEFIQQNKDKWKELEAVLDSTKKDPDRLTTLFIETTDDLSYSKTFYSNRSVKIYLNRLAQQVYQSIYKNKRRGKNRFSNFWIKELPEAMWHHRGELLQASLLFVAGVFIGMLSSMYYPEFAEIMLGSEYVQMTESNISSGNPMGVYQDADAVDMFFRIAFNNIRISFSVFVFGILFGMGTYFLVLYNSVMVGAFLYFFIERDLFREAFLAIMLHGTLELSMIVLSGCAGLALARGLLFPGTYKRSEALLMSARNGIKMMIAVSVFLVIASLIESFATRYSQLDGVKNGQLILDGFRLMLILISAAIVIGYFVIYPRYRFRKGYIATQIPEEIPERTLKIIQTDSIKSAGKIFAEAFFIWSKSAKQLALAGILSGLAFCLLFAFLTSGLFNAIAAEYDPYLYETYNPLSPLWVWNLYLGHFSAARFPLIYWFMPVAVSLWISFTSRLSLGLLHPSSDSFTTGFTKALVPALCFNICLLLPAYVSLPLVILLCPFALLLFSIATFESCSIMVAWRKIFLLLNGSYFKMISTFLLLLIPQWLCLFVLDSTITEMIGNFVSMNLPYDSYLAREIPSIINTFLLFALPAVFFSLSIFGLHLFYFSAREMNEAPALQTKLTTLGTHSRAYGLEKEA